MKAVGEMGVGGLGGCCGVRPCPLRSLKRTRDQGEKERDRHIVISTQSVCVWVTWSAENPRRHCESIERKSQARQVVVWQGGKGMGVAVGGVGIVCVRTNSRFL